MTIVGDENDVAVQRDKILRSLSLQRLEILILQEELSDNLLTHGFGGYKRRLFLNQTLLVCLNCHCTQMKQLLK